MQPAPSSKTALINQTQLQSISYLPNVDIKTLFRRKSIDQILTDIHTNENNKEHQLIKNLTLRDLVALGIAAVVGAGIFSTIGQASYDGGPAVSLLFIFTAIACAFSAMCYAEFASTIPISGSAYTYTYTSFGELAAWIIGWNLLLEYAIGNVVVAISWSDYFTGLLDGIGLHVPEFLTMDYRSAANGYSEVQSMLQSGTAIQDIPSHLQLAALAWQNAPNLGGIRLIADLPALLITLLITTIVYIGIQESKTTSNILVLLKVTVVILVIVVGSFYVNPDNWSPFAPNGIGGVLRGVSAVFFAYIGFDAISTTAEECKNPQRDLPRAMIYVLAICTVLYILVTLVLTGMVNYKELAVGDPLAFVFERLDLNVIAGIVAISAVVATTSVLLVFQLGQPRIWMTMSRDGLLPKRFSNIHPRFKTPSFATIIAGLLVAIPTLFFNLKEMTDFTSIGTLFAFALVSGGVLLLDRTSSYNRRGFKVPYINGKYIVTVMLVTCAFLVYKLNPEAWGAFMSLSVPEGTAQNTADGIGFWNLLEHKILMLGFILVSVLMAWLTYSRDLSLIPVLGLLINLYLMTELGVTNWARFIIWLFVGLIIYFAYGYKNSKIGLNSQTKG
jgi:basic amino acid/polyamine antiporter, APA family